MKRDWLPLLLIPMLGIAALPLVGSPASWVTLTVAGLAMGLMIFVMASGLTLTFGLMDVLNFGHGAFIAVGAFVAASVMLALGPWMQADSIWLNLAAFLPAILAAMAVSGVLGLAFEQVIVRPVYGQHLKQILVTTGGLIVAEQLLKVVWGPDQITLAEAIVILGGHDDGEEEGVTEKAEGDAKKDRAPKDAPERSGLGRESGLAIDEELERPVNQHRDQRDEHVRRNRPGQPAADKRDLPHRDDHDGCEQDPEVPERQLLEQRMSHGFPVGGNIVELHDGPVLGANQHSQYRSPDQQHPWEGHSFHDLILRDRVGGGQFRAVNGSWVQGRIECNLPPRPEHKSDSVVRPKL